MSTIDSLQIEIHSNSTDASKGIDALATSLGKLKSNGSFGTAIKNLDRLSTSLRNLTNVPSNSSKLRSVADAAEKLASVGSFAKTITQLNKLPSALKGMENLNVDGLDKKISSISSALSKLSSVKSSGFGSAVNSLGKLKDVTASLDDKTINDFVAKVELLTQKLGPLSTKLTTLKSAFSGISSTAQKSGNSVGLFGSKSRTAVFDLANLATAIQGVLSVLRPIIRLIGGAISEAIEWDGIASRFGRGFGEQAEEVYAWVQRLNQEMDINTQQFMQYSSTYATMLSGFGVGSKDASKMAVGYMELTYDIWAGYNDIYKSLDEAASAVRSAIAGEVEPVRKAGFTIIESTLKQTAANHGLEISLENATEAQKSYLRYLALTDQAHAQNLVGAYARELNTAEGVMRTFRQQLKSLAQTFGSVFLPILVEIMPWLQAFISLLGEAIRGVAQFFGIKIQEVNFGNGGSTSLENIQDSAEGATEGLEGTTGAIDDTTEALKDLKKATIGIDALNVISPQTDSGKGTGGADGADNGGLGAFEDLDIGSLWDESIFDSIQFQVDEIKSKIEGALGEITAIASGFALAIGLILALSGANIPLGLGLIAVGAVGLVATIVENWGDMSTRLAKVLTLITAVVGGFLLAIGALLTFSGVKVGLGIALMAAGAVSLATAATINWKFLDGDMKNALSILTATVGGASLALGALLAITGVGVGLGFGLMLIGASSLATAVGLNWDCLSEPMRKAIGAIGAIVGGGMLALGAILAFSGANIGLGIAFMAAGAVSLVSAVALNWGSLTGNVKNAIATISAIVGGALLGVGAILTFSGVNLPLGIALLSAGAIALIASASLNWGSIVNGIKSVLAEIGIIAGGALLALGILLCCCGIITPMSIGLIVAGATSLVSGVALNWNKIVDSVANTVKAIGDWWGRLWDYTWGGIKKMYDGVVNWFKNLWDVLVGHSIVPDTINSIVSWFTSLPSKILGSVKNFAGSVVNTFKDLGSGLVNKVSSAWSAVKLWWSKKSDLSKYTPSIGSIKDKLSSAWSTAKSWWDKTKSALSKYTPSIGSIKDKLSSAWSTAKKWWSKSKGVLSYTPSIGSIKDKLASAWSTAKKWWSNNVRLSIPSLSFKVTYQTSGLGTFKKAIVSALNLKGWPKLSFAKNGGMFDAGSLIWAGEAGAEIVANAGGGKTGVMNVDQMQEAVYEGVYAAVIAAMSKGGGGGEQSFNIYLDGKQITSVVEKRQRERGATLMGNQVYSY